MLEWVVVKQQSAKPAGIKQIAETLGISIGTVDRALHGRSGVNAETRAKVLKTAERLNYRPNVAARNLKLNRNLRLAVCLPEQIASFFDPLRGGIKTAAGDALGVRVEIDSQTYPRLGEGDLQLLQDCLKRDYDGIILTPGNPRKIDPILRLLAAREIPVVCVASDAPHSPHLASVCVDAYVSGGIAAELLAIRLAQQGSVAVVTGDLTTQDHAEKLRGFAAALAVMAPHLQLLPAVESHEQPEQAYRETLSLLARKPAPSGIYINTANSLPVIAAIEERGLLGRVQVVTTDLFPEIVPLIESGGVLATLHQRPFTQGKMALETLARHIAEGSKPSAPTRLAPHIVLRSNLPLFARQLAIEASQK
jgi:LacI family transcriptional regulator